MDKQAESRFKRLLVGPCTRRAKYGHYLKEGRCVECGITSAALAHKFSPAAKKEA